MSQFPAASQPQDKAHGLMRRGWRTPCSRRGLGVVLVPKMIPLPTEDSFFEGDMGLAERAEQEQLE